MLLIKPQKVKRKINKYLFNKIKFKKLVIKIQI